MNVSWPTAILDGGTGAGAHGIGTRKYGVLTTASELAEFARAVPDLTIISNHIGGLMRVGPYANRDDDVLATWRSGIAAVAQCPNVIIKLVASDSLATVLTGIPGRSPSARKSWPSLWHLDDVLHRPVWPRPEYVRK